MLSQPFKGNKHLFDEEFFHGHKIKSKVFGHTHKKMVFKIFNHFFYQFLLYY